MKKYLTISLVIFGLLVFGSSAWSLTVNSGAINVGDRDTLLAEALLENSGDATELNWVNSLGYGTFFMAEKYDTTSVDWTQTNVAGTWALQLSTDPAYYIIKVGTGSATTDFDDHFFFQNLDSVSYAVVNLVEDLNFGTDNYRKIQQVSRISHIGEFNGQVPEPSSLWLMGLGLLGLGFFARKRQ